jgi:hypothetical protein
MSKQHHDVAAELHEAAAKSHRLAAEHYGKGDHETANMHSAEAMMKARQAWDASNHASQKSDHHKTHA